MHREKMFGENLRDGWLEVVSELWPELLVGVNGSLRYQATASGFLPCVG